MLTDLLSSGTPTRKNAVIVLTGPTGDRVGSAPESTNLCDTTPARSVEASNSLLSSVLRSLTSFTTLKQRGQKWRAAVSRSMSNPISISPASDLPALSRPRTLNG